MWFTVSICAQKNKWCRVNVCFKYEDLHLMWNFNSLVHLLQETLRQLLESVSVVKRAVCTLMLPMINTTSPDPLSSVVVNFCKSNNTVVEASLQTLNEVCFISLLCETFAVNLFWVFFVLVFFANSELNQLWLSDPDPDDADKTRWDGDGGWFCDVGDQSVAKRDPAVGHAARHPPALLFWFCWPSAAQHWGPTYQHTGVMYMMSDGAVQNEFRTAVRRSSDGVLCAPVWE